MKQKIDIYKIYPDPKNIDRPSGRFLKKFSIKLVVLETFVLLAIYNVLISVYLDYSSTNRVDLAGMSIAFEALLVFAGVIFGLAVHYLHNHLYSSSSYAHLFISIALIILLPFSFVVNVYESNFVTTLGLLRPWHTMFITLTCLSMSVAMTLVFKCIEGGNKSGSK